MEPRTFTHIQPVRKAIQFICILVIKQSELGSEINHINIFSSINLNINLDKTKGNVEL